MGSLIKCILGPRLYHVCKFGENESHSYIPNSAESLSDGIIKSISWVYSFGIYSSPVAIAVFYKRGFFNLEGFAYLVKFFGTVGIILLASVFIRGIGRYTNVEYLDFIYSLKDAKSRPSKQMIDNLRRYDFDFKDWPVDFSLDQIEGEGSKPKVYLSSSKSSKRSSVFDNIKALPCQVLSYLVIHSFGRRLIYPGSVGLLQTAMEPVLREGRLKLIEQHGGRRVKLQARDGNHIDSMFVDRRHKTENGSILFIGCEGNAAFYEVGVLGSILEAGYSAMGWNHPGFGGSTGIPFPEQEANAVDVVIQYAINELGFKVGEIVMFAWSIGGFTATWAGMNYPELKAVILDATFDDLVPLAVNKMPSSWKPLVIRTIKEYMNLNHAQQLNQYPGPILLIRRTLDEMISTEDPSLLAGNRGNNLLIKLLQHRYPNIVTVETLPLLKQWLSCDTEHQEALLSQYEVEDDLNESLISSYILQHDNTFPMMIGDDLALEQKKSLMLYLASKYMIDIDTTHCTPLPSELVRLPWNPDPRS